MHNCGCNPLESFRLYLESILPGMPFEDWDAVTSASEIISLDRGAPLFAPDTVHDSVYILLTGAVRCFEYAAERDVTVNLFVEYEVLVDCLSIQAGKPSGFVYRAQEPCLLIRFQKDKLAKMLLSSHFLSELYRRLFERKFNKELEFRRFLLRMNASERYLFLMRHKPEYLMRFPLKDIASFMGITPTSLSRLRKTKSLL